MPKAKSRIVSKRGAANIELSSLKTEKSEDDSTSTVEEDKELSSIVKVEAKVDEEEEATSIGIKTEQKTSSRKRINKGDTVAQKKRVTKAAKLEVKEEEAEEENHERNNGTTSRMVTGAAAARQLLNAVREAAKASTKLLGAHVSAQGGPHNAITNALEIGCQAFALFVRNQRRWESQPMTEEAVKLWEQTLEATGFPLDRIVPHGSYLINAGSPDPKKLEMSRKAILDECQRCERLGIGLYNFHPGSTTGIGTKEQCLERIAESINYVIERTKFITLVVETMCGSGHTVGDRFEHFAAIISQVKDKNRVGVCIDTCHTFAAGYDLTQKRTYAKAMAEFEQHIGFKYLKAVHLNDSGGKLSSRVDRHRNIGSGELGMSAFRLLMQDPRFDGIPMVLETPEGKYVEEMDTLYRLEKEKKTAKVVKWKNNNNEEEGEEKMSN